MQVSWAGAWEWLSHLLECQAYGHLRIGIDPQMESDRAPYLLKVVARRKELEEQLGKGARSSY